VYDDLERVRFFKFGVYPPPLNSVVGAVIQNIMCQMQSLVHSRLGSKNR
jgi:hypothetical protein